MSIPNLLTLFRLATAPLFLALFIGSGQDGFLDFALTPQQGILACIVVAALSELSDILDGILARRLGQVSNFGMLLDPYADSTFRLSVYFAFASHAHGPWIPLWMVMVLFYRDLLVTVIRTFGVERRVFVHARGSGKIKAIAQGTVAITVMTIAAIAGEAYVSYGNPVTLRLTGVAHSLMWIVTLVTVWSAGDYAWHNRHLFRSVPASESNSDAPPPS